MLLRAIKRRIESSTVITYDQRRWICRECDPQMPVDNPNDGSRARAAGWM